MGKSKATAADFYEWCDVNGIFYTTKDQPAIDAVGMAKIKRLLRRPSGWEERAVEVLTGNRPKAPATEAAPPGHLDKEERLILRALATARGLLTQEEIEAAIPGLAVSVRTIQRRLKKLETNGLVARPKGPRKGWAITPAGMEAVKASW